MESKGIARAISELGEIINDLRAVVENKNLHIDKLIEDMLSKNARIKELEDRLSKRPERIRREDQGLDKWNK